MKKKLQDKINNNDTFTLMKNLWGNKRYRSILYLGLYFIFFSIIIINLRSNYKDDQNYVEVKEDNVVLTEVIKNQYNELGNYDYTISINDIELLHGNVDDNFNNFSYNNQDYVIISDNVYLQNNDDLKKVSINENSNLLVPINLLMPNRILDYIINLTPIDEDGNDVYKIIYEMDNDYFDIDGDYKVQVSINGDSKIRDINLDLSEYANEDYIIRINLDYSKLIEE